MVHLITGGSGFIGSKLAQRLLRSGERVRILDIVDDPLRSPEIEYLQGSVADRDVVACVMQGVDVVHHHAALVAQSSAGSAYWSVNRDGAAIVAQESVRAGVARIVHVSSTSIYGLPPAGPITSVTNPAPFEAYGRSKLAGEQIMHAVCNDARLPLVTIRPRVTLGPGRLGIFDILFDWISEGKRIPVIGSGKQIQQFVHVDDLIDFYMLALDNDLRGYFNVGTDRFQSLETDLENLIGYAKSASEVRTIPVWPAVTTLQLMHAFRASPLGPWHYKTYHRDCYFETEPLTALGWTPRYSNSEMLQESYDWFLANRYEYGVGNSPHRSKLRQGMLRLVKAFF